MFFCFAFKNIGVCSVLCISSLKSIGIYSTFCVFALFRPKALKRKNVVIYSILLLSENHTSSEKCVKTVFFFPILGTFKTGIMLLETPMSDLDSVQKTLPQQLEGF